MSEKKFVKRNYLRNESKESERMALHRAQLNKLSYKNLYNFLNTYKLSKDATSKDFNIMDQYYGGKYNIPNYIIPEFFEYLEQCRKDQCVLNLCELQTNSSCLMLDFDIEQPIDMTKSQIRDYDHLYPLVRETMKVIMEVLTIDSDIKACVLITKKPEPVVKEEKYQKDGFHMIISGIKISKKIKKYIIKKIIEDGVLTSTLSGIKLYNTQDINSVLDTNSAHVPVLLYGSCKKSITDFKFVYKKHKIYSLTINQNSIYPEIQEYKNDDDFNIAYEFSLNFENPNGIIRKNVYVEKKKYSDKLNTYKKIHINEENKTDLSILTMSDPDAKEYIRYINILGEHRWEHYHWWRIIGAIAKRGIRFKPIAIAFNDRNPNINSKKWLTFETEWNNALNKKKYPHDLPIIKKYAKEDNPEEYKLIKNEIVFSKAYKMIFDKNIQGMLDHNQMAKLLKLMIGDKFMSGYKKEDNKHKWFEFILPGDEHKSGELYKWREYHCDILFSLSRYISDKLPEVFKKQIMFLDNLIKSSTDENLTKWYIKTQTETRTTIRKLANHGFKNGIMKELMLYTDNTQLFEKMDKEKNIFGVRQGLLQFGCKTPKECKDSKECVCKKECKLINRPHDYKVSRYSHVEYKKIDPRNKKVQDVYKNILDLFPNNERDVFHYILFFISTSLTTRTKAALIIMLTGNGANGKSYLVELITSLLGSVNSKGYGTKIPISYLIEGDQHSSNASPVIMTLKYATFAYFSESNRSETLNTAKLKRLTAHERITGRPLYGKPTEFKPKANLMMCTNYSFRVKCKDHGTWRRIKKYNCKIKFCKNPDEKNIYERPADSKLGTDTINDPEYLSAFLSILVMYLTIFDVDYKGDLLNVKCPTIDKETETYRNSQDIVNKFINKKVIKCSDEKKEYSMDTLVKGYTDWYEKKIRAVSNHWIPGIKEDLRNSKLCKYFITKENSDVYLQGYRVAEDDEIPGEGECYMYQLETKKNKVTNNITEDQDLDSNSLLLKTYNRYQEILSL